MLVETVSGKVYFRRGGNGSTNFAGCNDRETGCAFRAGGGVEMKKVYMAVCTAILSFLKCTPFISIHCGEIKMRKIYIKYRFDSHRRCVDGNYIARAEA